MGFNGSQGRPGTAAAAAVTACALYLSGNQAITTNTWTVVTWNAETKDDDALHSLVTNPSRITVSDTGWWRFDLRCGWASNANSYRAFELRVDGAGSYGLTIEHPNQVTSHYHSGSVLLYLTAGSYVDVRVLHNVGGDLNLLGGTASDTTITAQFVGA